MVAHPQGDTFARADVILEIDGSTGPPRSGPERLGVPPVLVVLPSLPPPRCAREGHRLYEGATYCAACRALSLWPGLDRRKLGRAAPKVERIARLAERRSGFDIDTIIGMLMRRPVG